MGTAVAESVVGTPAADAAATAAADAAAASAAAASTQAATDAAAATAAAATAASVAAAAAAAKPVDYTLVLPKDSTLDASAIERTTAIARELGLSDTAAAQKVLDLVHEQTAAHAASMLAAHQPGGAEWTKQLDAWKAETLADQSLGKTPEERAASVALAGTVLRQYKEAHPADAAGIDAFMNTSGLGEHPAAVKLFHWLGKAAGERSLVHGSDTSVSPGDKLAQMYPSMTPKT